MSKFAAKYRSLGSGMIATAMRRTINDAATRKGKPVMVRVAIARGGWDRQAYARKRVTAYSASAGSLTSKVVAKQKHYSLVNNFSPIGKKAAGRPFYGASPWGRSRTYKKAFYVTSKFGGHLVPVMRAGNGKLRGIYGPSVAREVERDMKESGSILREIKDYAVIRAAHHFSYAAQVAKSRAGL